MLPYLSVDTLVPTSTGEDPRGPHSSERNESQGVLSIHLWRLNEVFIGLCHSACIDSTDPTCVTTIRSGSTSLSFDLRPRLLAPTVKLKNLFSELKRPGVEEYVNHPTELHYSMLSRRLCMIVITLYSKFPSCTTVPLGLLEEWISQKIPLTAPKPKSPQSLLSVFPLSTSSGGGPRVGAGGVLPTPTPVPT